MQTPDPFESVDRNREAFRWLLLPVEFGAEEAAVTEAVGELESMGIDEGDIPTWLNLEIENWKSTGRASRDLQVVVLAYIGADDDGFSSLLAERYFAMHERLAREPLLDHEGASALLSHVRLIARLASDERLSAAQIAKLIAARDARTPVIWRHIDTILTRLDFRPSLGIEDVRRLYQTDKVLELEAFADAEESVCIEMVADAAQRLGFPGSLLLQLRALFPGKAVPKGPYLQILHFQCMLAEFYDHDLSAIYEFNPRGETSDWLFDQYPDSLGVAGNPFLNNAKSVDKLGPEWARSKGKGPTRGIEAQALVEIIEGLDSMGFASRRELASWIRRLLVHRIQLAEGMSVDVPSKLASTQARQLIHAITVEETRTRGILEQRLLDALCSLKHPLPNWIARGLKDSVNTTNVSRKKCGDCDFQDSANRTVVAYEAHAGRLTDLYIRAHLRTVGQILAQRKQEWAENVGPDLDWTLTIVFVGHELDIRELWMTETVEGISVTVEFLTFAQLVAGIGESDAAILSALEGYLLEPLSRPRTPDPVRRRLNDLLSGS